VEIGRYKGRRRNNEVKRWQSLTLEAGASVGSNPAIRAGVPRGEARVCRVQLPDDQPAGRHRPVYRDPFRGQRFPVAERLCASGFYLPTHESMTEPDADWICRQIADIHRLAAGASRRR